jgi:RNA recognition motif-containing protein
MCFLRLFESDTDCFFSCLKVEVKNALRKHEIIAPVKQQTKIFIGGIPQEVTWEELHGYFSQFGEIIGGQIMVRSLEHSSRLLLSFYLFDHFFLHVRKLTFQIDKKTKRSRGFGFVKFLHEESVSLAFSMEHYIHFKKVCTANLFPLITTFH